MEVELKFIFGRFAVYSPLGAMRCDLMFVCLSLFHFGLFFTPPSHSFPSLSHSEFNVYMALLYDCYRKSPIFRFLFNSRVLWKSSFISSASTSFFFLPTALPFLFPLHQLFIDAALLMLFRLFLFVSRWFCVRSGVQKCQSRFLFRCFLSLASRFVCPFQIVKCLMSDAMYFVSFWLAVVVSSFTSSDLSCFFLTTNG